MKLSKKGVFGILGGLALAAFGVSSIVKANKAVYDEVDEEFDDEIDEETDVDTDESDE